MWLNGEVREKILVTHRLPGRYLENLKEDYEVVYGSIREIGDCVGLICLLTDKVDGKVMGNLRVIGNYAVGFDNIDIEEETKRGIVVVNTPGVLTEAVAEHVIALTLALSRRIVEGDQFVRAGRYKGWEPDLLVGTGLRGKVMGIVGLGRIGRWVGRIAQGIGMDVIYNSPHRDEEYELECKAEYKSLNRVLEQADVVSVNVPLTEETRGMIGREQFNIMKKTALLINTARGAVVKSDDLISALREGKIAGAGLDVFENENEVSLELRRLPNVVLTPHIASATIEARLMMAELVIDGVREVLNGKCPENIVNKEVWEKRK